MEPNQGRFAQRIGIKQGKWSAIENGRNEAKAEDLATLAAAGIDVQYVLTGVRSADRLGAESSELVTIFEGLDIHLRGAVLSFVRHVRAGPPAREPAPAPSALPDEAALEQMFEGLLLASERLTGAELARELARRLPIALGVARAPKRRPDRGEQDETAAVA